MPTTDPYPSDQLHLISRQEGLKLGQFSFRNAFQRTFQPLVGINVLGFTRSKEAIHHGNALSSILGAGEEIIFSSQSQGLDLVFDQVIIKFYIAKIHDTDQFRPWLRKHPTNCPCILCETPRSGRPQKSPLHYARYARRRTAARVVPSFPASVFTSGRTAEHICISAHSHIVTLSHFSPKRPNTTVAPQCFLHPRPPAHPSMPWLRRKAAIPVEYLRLHRGARHRW